ncbi:GNAT family N-acetyltransferase [Candidatus Peregrinibacteria bacterium]|nr:MAG: GNAT family N-acetyltransferase [Candidatus Peregrinibacteria bacterium]
MNYTFKPVTEKDFPLLLEWHNQPWVAENWNGYYTSEQIEEEQIKKMKSSKDFAYIIYFEGRPFAYIQLQDCFECGDGWWPDEKPGTWGIDTFIGEEEYLGKGHSTKYIKEFLEKAFSEKNAKKIIVDPDPNNIRAIKAYEKAGFKAVETIKTPDGDALLMEVKASFISS